MKKTIQILKEVVRVNTVEKEIDLPEVDKYYTKTDDGRFFPEGKILFAILVDHPGYYKLIRVTKNRQEWTDFLPAKDCKSEYWNKDSNKLRSEAFNIIEDSWANDFDEISEEQFYTEREELINDFIKSDK